MKRSFHPESKETLDLVMEFSSELKKDPTEEGRIKMLPEGVTMECDLDGKQLLISFNEEYKKMDNVREVLVRQGIVDTFLQIPAIDAVVFEIAGEPLKENFEDETSPEIGRMTRESFVSDVSDNMHTFKYIPLSLYFANEDGTKLIKQTVSVAYSSTKPLERLVIEQLIEGPSKKGFYSTIPKETKLLSVSIKDGICYVNLDKGFLDLSTDVDEEIPIYSIVNSISDMCKINKVQISIEGKTDLTYRDNISFETTFERNLDIIEIEENESEIIQAPANLDKEENVGVEGVLNNIQVESDKSIEEPQTESADPQSAEPATDQTEPAEPPTDTEAYVPEGGT
ncbi:MAG TPA: GerMN domain-containing protein [Candidatus Merdenecus merdavium]|nr:GerMN domain-containing protein [Candidatus Merdenecus merdavium]